jgi:GT2 family glycosyltransferase
MINIDKIYQSLRIGKMKLYIICVAYERPIALRLLIDSFLLQTNPNWELIIIHDGLASKEVLKTIGRYYYQERFQKQINEFWFESQERYGLFGHPNRRKMLQMLKGNKDDYILITNDDNYYVPFFIEYLMKVADRNVGFIYCDAITRVAYEDQITRDYKVLYSQIEISKIDMGSFIVRLDIAKKVGFDSDLFHADGIYAVECCKECKRQGLKPEYVDKPLYVHN